MHEFWQHPQLAARERWRDIGSPVGSIPALLPPGNWDDGDGPRMDPVPALGQHTDALLAELGYGAEAIAALRAAQAL
jgi:crotonobetainyl-CoA:carnitine CoA-transferase CaiB-like acyl-CoA transferase